MSPRTLAVLVAAAALPLSACGSLDLRRAAATPTHLVSHQLCSATFVSGLEPERFYREAVAHDVGPVAGFLSHHVDREKQEVTATFKGPFTVQSRAVYRGDTGCVVVQGPLPPAPTDPGPKAASLLPPIAGPEVVTPTDLSLIHI